MAYINKKHFLAKKLVFAYTVQDRSSATGRDSSLFNKQGTISNGTLNEIGLFGNQLDFDGADDVLNFGANTRLDGLTPLTVIALVRPRSVGENRFGHIWANGNGYKSLFINQYGNFGMEVVATSGSVFHTGPAGCIRMNDYVWLGATWDGSLNGSGILLYQNGTVVPSYDATANGTTGVLSDVGQSWYIGNRSDGTRTFDGEIACVLVLNRIVSAKEFTEHYSDPWALFKRTSFQTNGLAPVIPPLTISVNDSITITESKTTFISSVNAVIDNFNDNSLDSKWISYTGTGGSVAETNRQIEMTSSASAGATSGIYTGSLYDLTGSSITMRVVYPGDITTLNSTAYQFRPLWLYLDGNNYIRWGIDGSAGGIIYFWKRVGGVSSFPGGFPAYSLNDLVTYRYLRIRESAGTIYADYSSDYVNWTNFTSFANPFAITALEVDFAVYNDPGTASTTAIIDDVNIQNHLFISVNDTITITESKTVTRASALISSLFDNFDDNSLNTGKWNDTTSNVAETNGQIQITNDTGGVSKWIGSNTPYDLTGLSMSVRIVDLADTTINNYAFALWVYNNSNNYLRWKFSYNGSNTIIEAIKTVAGVGTSLFNATYDSVTHRYIRFRELSGTTYWEYSSDYVNWTTAWSEANPISVTAFNPYLELDNGATATTIVVKIDDFDIQGTLFINVNDTATITESLTLNKINLINVNDTVTITENVTVSNLTLTLSVSDTITVTENVDKYIIDLISVNDAITLTESNTVAITSGGLDISVNDSITVTESVTLNKIHFISVNDTITLTENINVSNLLLYNSVFDAVSVSESNTLLITLIINVNDSIGITESITVQNSNLGNITVNDSITVTESINELIIKFVNVNDSITINESLTVQNLTLSLSVNDSITISESINVNRIYLISVSDSVTLTESLVIANANLGNISVNDAITLIENTNVLEIDLINTNDTVTITENVIVSNILLSINVNDSITLTESILVNRVYLINVSDNVNLTESNTNLLISFISVNENIAITENVTQLITLFVNISDSITITENISILNTKFISVFETIALTETSTVLNTNLNISVFETITVNEFSVASTTNDIFISVTDDIVLIENITILNSNLGAIFIIDVISIAENLSNLITNFINIIDTIIIVENINVENTYLYLNINDNITLTENSNILNSNLGFISVNDQINISESNIILNTDLGNISVSDNITISEFITFEQAINIFASDLLGVAESVIISNDRLNFEVFEDITLQEHISLENHLSNLSVFDIVYIEDIGLVEFLLETLFLDINDLVDVNDVIVSIVRVATDQYVVYLKSKINSDITLSSKIIDSIKLSSKINSNTKLSSKHNNIVKLSSKGNDQVRLTSSIGGK
jgi:hypothetical protein